MRQEDKRYEEWLSGIRTGIGPSGRLDLRYCAENKPNGFKEEKAEFYN